MLYHIFTSTWKKTHWIFKTLNLKSTVIIKLQLLDF